MMTTSDARLSRGYFEGWRARYLDELYDAGHRNGPVGTSSLTFAAAGGYFSWMARSCLPWLSYRLLRLLVFVDRSRPAFFAHSSVEGVIFGFAEPVLIQGDVRFPHAPVRTRSFHKGKVHLSSLASLFKSGVARISVGLSLLFGFRLRRCRCRGLA